MTKRSLPLPRPAVLVALLVALVALMAPVLDSRADAATVAAVDASARPVAARPALSQDYPKMPAHCATHREEIPQHPVVCRLNGFHAAYPTIVLWGDSHAWMMIPALEAAIGHRHVNLVATVMGGCPAMDPDLAPGQSAPSCDESNQMAIDYVTKLQRRGRGVHVLIGGSWQRYYHALHAHDHRSYEGQQALQMRRQTPRLFRTLAALSVPVTVTGQVATVPEHAPKCRRGRDPYSCDLSVPKALPQARATQHWLYSLMAPLPGKAIAINVNYGFCSDHTCHGVVKGVHTWFDDLHLSASRARKLAPYYQPLVRRALADANSSGSSDGSDGSGGSGDGSGGDTGGGGGCPIPLLCP